MAMLWSDERYVRLYTRDTTTWLMLPWQGRCVFMAMLRKVDRAGVLDVGEDGIEGLAVRILLPLEVVEVGLPHLIKRGSVEVSSTCTCYVLPNFIEAQEANASDKARSRAARERIRDRARGESSRSVTVRHDDPKQPKNEPVLADLFANRTPIDSVEIVTPRDDKQRHVSTRHATNEIVTPNQPNQTDRRTERSVDGREKRAVDPAPPVPSVQVFDYWRSTMGLNGSTKFDAKRRRYVAAQLAEGRSVADLCRAIDGCKLDPFSMGENDRGRQYNDLSIILRDADHVERFMSYVNKPPAPIAPRSAAQVARTSINAKWDTIYADETMTKRAK